MLAGLLNILESVNQIMFKGAELDFQNIRGYQGGCGAGRVRVPARIAKFLDPKISESLGLRFHIRRIPVISTKLGGVI